MVMTANDQADPGATAYFARQPLFDRTGAVVGYELLYRPTHTADAAYGADPEHMAAQVVADAVLATDLAAATDGTRAFLNAPRGLLTNPLLESLDPGQIVIEILESVVPDGPVVEACTRLGERGYVLALDDFAPDDARAPLLPFVSFVKVDVLGRSVDEVLQQAGPLTRMEQLQLVAERVETVEQYQSYADAGFDLFQGFFFQRPELIAKRDLKPAQLGLIEALNLAGDERVSDHRIADHFKHDTALAYKVVRMANVAGLGARNIHSVQHAIQLVGRDALSHWIALLLAASYGRESGLRRELLRTALVRSRMCELLGARLGPAASGHLFLVGLFSRLEALLSVPLADVLPRIALPAAAEAALLRREGPYAGVLEAVDAYEAADWERLARAGAAYSAAGLSHAYDQAVRWADAVTRDI